MYAALAGIGSRLVGFIWIALLVGGLYATTPAYANTYNVKNYGAQGNGTTDDTQAISNAIAAANEHPGAGNVVLFPAGTYLIDDSTPPLNANGVTLSGESPSTSIIKVTNPFLQISISGKQGGVKNLTIEFVQDSLSTVNPALLIKQDADFFNIENNRFTGFNIGIQISECDAGTIRSNTFSVTGSRSTCIDAEVVNATLTVDRNSFTSDSPGSAYGIYNGTSFGVLTLDARNNTFSNLNYGLYGKADVNVKLTSNTFSNVYYAIYTNQCTEVTATSNTINSSYYGLYCQYADNLIFNSNTVTGATYGVFGYNNYKTTTIESNKILSNKYNAIYYEYASPGGVTIANNEITGNGGQVAVYLFTAPLEKITNNTISGFSQAGIGLLVCGTSTIDQNSVTNISKGDGIDADAGNQRITNNKLSEIGNQGISVSSSDILSVNGNQIKDCGLYDSIDAVIFVSPEYGAQPSYDAKLTGNTYSGNQNGINYFIYVRDGHAELQDNKTNTTLPSYP
jgi:parallel beta-helix repeat protein